MKEKMVKLFLHGPFYRATGDDALVIHALMDYALIKDGTTVGFPVSTLDKVVNRLNKFHVSYAVFNDSNTQTDTKDFNNANKYDYYLDVASDMIPTEEKFKEILSLIKNLSFEELSGISNFIYEYKKKH